MPATIDDRVAELERANAQLRWQLDACSAELKEARAQQTATAEVLQVINSSPGDLAPVFDAMLEKAMRLCEAAYGMLYIYEDGTYRTLAVRDLPPAYAESLKGVIVPGKLTALGRLASGERIVHIADLREDDAYRAREPQRVDTVELGGARTYVGVPLLNDGAMVGAIAAYRQEVRPFTDKQIALLQNFAAQAVIAMENARLLTETREALEQQTATAEVLKVINSSPGDLTPVFDAVLDKAMRLCSVDHAALELYDGERFHAVAVHGASDRFAATLRHGYRATDSPAGRALLEGGRFVQIADAAQIDHVAFRAAAEVDGIRTVLFIPLRRDDALLGMIASARREVRLFSEKEIALLENFAAQAVIAIENARLLTETREALEQQTATAEVLQVINSSPGDLAPVFDTILEKAHTLCGAAHGSLTLAEGEHCRAVATRGMPEEFASVLRQPFHPGLLGEQLSSGEPFVQIADITATPTDSSVHHAAVGPGGVRTLLAVPLRKEGALLGYITANRQEVRPFSDKQIALLQNFAAQAVIAMENARLITETREALEQQTATAEVLQVINSSPGDLTPVFDATLEKATHLCDGVNGILWTIDGKRARLAASLNMPSAIVELLRQQGEAGEHPMVQRVIAGEHLFQFYLAEHDVYRLGEVAAAPHVVAAGVRTIIWVAMVKDGAAVGAFVISRNEIRPFTDKQIALLQNFAAQAVIAMENARLITETREALAQQTATAEVLQVINSSPGDLNPVFDAMLEKAMRLCEAAFGMLWTYEGDRFQAAALRGVPSAFAEFLGKPLGPFHRGTGLGRMLDGEDLAIHPDMVAEEAYRAGDPLRHAIVDLGGARSAVTVSLRRDNTLLGAFTVYRREVRPFSDKQIALLQNFAAQAVIAIENARLLGELRQRTRDLQESLEYQTATSDVLKVISRTGSEAEPVLETMVETAARLCEAEMAFIYQFHDGRFRLVASHGIRADIEDFITRNPFSLDRGTLTARTALERRVVHIEDAANDPEYTWTEMQRLANLHTMLGVPLLREDTLVGVLGLHRSRVVPFTEKQIALVSTFADQAVIAIENARLFNELRARTAELGRSVEELQMLSEVGQAVSSTLDLRSVLSTILTQSVGLSGADAGAVFRYSRAERAFRLVEAFGWDEALTRSVGDLRVAEGETAMGEAAARRTPIQLSDLAERPSAPLRDASLAAGFRGVLIVPLVGPQRILGALVLQRREAGEFPAETVRLMQTLASQSVLAIQNARLFREIADKSEQLALASQHKSQFLANMSHELRTPLNAILGYAELLVDGIYGVLPEKAQGVLERVQNNGKHLLALINDVLDLAKIEAGQLALTIEDYNLPEVVRAMVSATEPLAAAKGLKFTATIEDNMPRAHGDARRVSQVLLNLAGNAIKFTDQGEVEINASAVNGQFVLTVRDTGPGIADADQERIFGEFQQIENTDTRKKGGTGLGLAISKRMVEMQGGMISVESALGRGSTFRVVLPVQVEAMTEA